MLWKETVLSFYAILTVFRGCLGTNSELTVDIQPGSRECFHQYIDKGSVFEFEYQVVDGGDMDINCVIQAPSGGILISELRKEESYHSLTTQEAGDFAFCLDNTFSRFSRKVVFFELVIDDDEGEEEEFEVLAAQEDYEVKLDDFKDGLYRIKGHVEKSRQVQNVLRAIETRDRSVQESNFDRVNFWSGIQLFVMVSVAITNVLMIRGFFEEKSRHTKVGIKART